MKITNQSHHHFTSAEIQRMEAYVFDGYPHAQSAIIGPIHIVVNIGQDTRHIALAAIFPNNVVHPLQPEIKETPEDPHIKLPPKSPEQFSSSRIRSEITKEIKLPPK